MRPPERGLPRTDHKDELLVTARFDFADLGDKVDDFVPTEITRELSLEEAGEQESVIMAHL